jgi:hypothetical protein
MVSTPEQLGLVGSGSQAHIETEPLRVQAASNNRWRVAAIGVLDRTLLTAVFIATTHDNAPTPQ